MVYTSLFSQSYDPASVDQPKTCRDLRPLMCSLYYLNNIRYLLDIKYIILVPDGEDIYFCEITSDYYLDDTYDNNTYGYPHQRKVKWLSDTLRKDLSKSLRSSLKVHRTTAVLSKHLEDINSLSQGKEFISTANECETIPVKYPLRQNFTVSFKIPTDITKVEAKRLSLYIKSLYFSE